MSHEIKTPLQAILGMLDLLEQTDIDETQRSYIKHVSHSASLLQTILHDVLDLSKIETKSMVLESISFNLHFLLESSVIQMTDKAKSKNISLQLKLANDVPKFIVGDQHRLSQILFNLIKNAIKFTSEGGVVLTVERNRNKLRFTVVDTGTGMPSDSIAKLFKPFVQLDSSISRKYGGTGLGLAICKRLVEHMGGKIGVKSKLGVGSTFWFDLPLKIPSGLIGAESIRKIEKNKNLQYDILLADDSQINQFVIKTMLEKLGHTVELASNGQEAIEACKKKLPNLCFMDLRMPIMDGIEATRYIISEIADIPIVALTANSSDEERIECRKAGMISIASKPVTTTILKNLLSEFEHIIVEKSARLSIPIRECEGSKATSVDNIVSKDNSKLNEKVAGNTKDSSNSEIVSDSVNDLNEMITSKPAKYDNSLKASSNNRISLHEFHEYSLKDGHEIIQDVIKGNKALKDKKLVEDIDIDTDTNSQSEAMRIEERIALDKNVEALDEILLHGDEIISSLNLNLQSDKSKSDTDKDKTNK
jgi:CheY-like chemotaxis protein